MKKISFLMAVHNEEKILEKSLTHLSKNIPYNNYEVLIGLDGCTDNSLNIVKKFSIEEPKKFKYFILNERNGKPPVINYIIKKAKGSIIIINDADWMFTSQDKNGIIKLVSIFNDKRIGGIAESFPAELDAKMSFSHKFGYKMVLCSSYYWFKYQKKNYCKFSKNIGVITSPNMWLTNIFRKELFIENTSLGDDFERTQNIYKQGKHIALFNNSYSPRMIAIYNNISIIDLFNQKIRTAIARKQLDIGDNHTSLIGYMIKESIKDKMFVPTFSWIVLTSLATVCSKFKNEGTQEAWNRRVRR